MQQVQLGHYWCYGASGTIGASGTTGATGASGLLVLQWTIILLLWCSRMRTLILSLGHTLVQHVARGSV